MDKTSKFMLSKQLFLLDGDGTLYLWDKPLESSTKFIKKIRELGKDFIILSNNDSESKLNRLKFLRKILDVDITEDNLLLPNDLVAASFTRRKVKSFDGLISDEFKDELVSKGFRYDRHEPDIILIGFDTDLTYKKMKRIIEHINRGKKFILTHIDPLCPYKGGQEIPDAGLLSYMIERATKKEPVETLGKPFKGAIEYLRTRIDLPRDKIVVIGDRLDTDIKMANENAIDSIWLYKDKSSLRGLNKSRYRPTFYVKNLAELYSKIKDL
ncbi:MAG: HAD-IIA family hydrolase [Candidatus Micrarchaeaceae archaeon]